MRGFSLNKLNRFVSEAGEIVRKRLHSVGFKAHRMTRLPDLSRSYMDPAIPAKQRALVDRQLQEMYAGHAPAHFLALIDIFREIQACSGNETEFLTLLDAGCASAYYSEILSHLVPMPLKYHGADFNEAMLQLARKIYRVLPLARMDLRHLAWLDGSFDVVLSGAVIVHIREWQSAVSEIARVARKWVVLHRALVCERSTFIRVERHSDVDVYRVFIREKELLSHMCDMGFQLRLRVECDEGNVGPDVGEYTYLFLRDRETPHA